MRTPLRFPIIFFPPLLPRIPPFPSLFVPFFSPPCTRAFLFFLSLSRIWFTGFLSDADTPRQSVSCFPKGSTKNNKNSKKKKNDASNRPLSNGNEARFSKWTRIGPSVQFLLRQLANSKRNSNIFNLGSILIALKFRRAVEKGEASLLVLLFIECCQTVFNKYLRIKYPSINQSVRE